MKKEIKLNEYEIGMLSPGDKILVAIPTRDRPEYLSILLSSLIHQTEQAFDVLIVDTSDEKRLDVSSAPVERFLSTLTALGHACFYEHVNVAGRSEAAAVNVILTTALFNEYDLLYKTDDDHLLQPDTLARLKSAHGLMMAEHCCPVMVSAMTPYMHRVKEGLSGPDSPPIGFLPKDMQIIKYGFDEGKLSIEANQFDRCLTDQGIHPSMLASAANFMMKPDARILWQDLSQSSLHADAVWMLQLETFFGYKFFFDTGCTSWHVTAPSGGVRSKFFEYSKNEIWDERRKQHFKYLVETLPKK
jgi:glycosyltransferase involved in cell wall biosynthesis